MVLKKSEWEEKKKIDLTQFVGIVSAFIDKRLLNQKMQIPTKDIKHFVQYQYQEELLSLVIKIYEQAGWKVKRVSGYDCRDVNDSWDYLQFS